MQPSSTTATWPAYSTTFDLGWYGQAEALADKLRPAFASAPDLALLWVRATSDIAFPAGTIAYRSPLPQDQAEAAALAVVDAALGGSPLYVVTAGLLDLGLELVQIPIPTMPQIESVNSTIKLVAFAAVAVAIVYVLATAKRVSP